MTDGLTELRINLRGELVDKDGTVYAYDGVVYCADEVDYLLERKDNEIARLRGELNACNNNVKEIEVKLDASGKPLDWDDVMNLDEFSQEIANPRLEAARAYAHRFERDAMETALRFGCRAVYVVEWTENHDFNDDKKWGTRYDICWKCFPYECRRDAFRLCKEKGGRVRIIDFKFLNEIPCDIFCRIDSPNRDLAEQIREKFVCVM